MKRLTAFLMLTGHYALWARARDNLLARHESGRVAVFHANRDIERGMGSRVRWSSVPTCLKNGLTLIHGPVTYTPARKTITRALAYLNGFTS